MLELLVVIAIIAILAAILLPAFGKARARAYSSKCMSNLRQQAIASLAYADDDNEILPIHNTLKVNPYNGLTNRTCYMVTYLLIRGGYLKTGGIRDGRLYTDVFVCPSEKPNAINYDTVGTLPHLEYENATATFRNGTSGIINTVAGGDGRQGNLDLNKTEALEPLFTNYAFNGTYPTWGSPPVWPLPYTMPFGTPFTNAPVRRLSEATIPSDTWLAGDSAWADVGLRTMVFPHLNFSRNFAYLDGHVENLRTTQVDADIWTYNNSLGISDARLNMIR